MAGQKPETNVWIEQKRGCAQSIGDEAYSVMLEALTFENSVQFRASPPIYSRRFSNQRFLIRTTNRGQHPSLLPFTAP